MGGFTKLVWYKCVQLAFLALSLLLLDSLVRMPVESWIFLRASLVPDWLWIALLVAWTSLFYSVFLFVVLKRSKCQSKTLLVAFVSVVAFSYLCLWAYPDKPFMNGSIEAFLVAYSPELGCLIGIVFGFSLAAGINQKQQKGPDPI